MDGKSSGNLITPDVVVIPDTEIDGVGAGRLDSRRRRSVVDLTTCFVHDPPVVCLDGTIVGTVPLEVDDVCVQGRVG